jgi:bacterioferritin
VRLLNESLATEIVCVLRYRRHHYMANGIHATAVAEEFLKHSQEEQGHADQIAERIVQLGARRDFDPAGLSTRSRSEYVAADELVEMIRENLVAERVAIESYSEIIRYIGEGDPTTRRLMEEILAVEEEHADDMKTLLEALGPQAERTNPVTARSEPAGRSAPSTPGPFRALASTSNALRRRQEGKGIRRASADPRCGSSCRRAETRRLWPR